MQDNTPPIYTDSFGNIPEIGDILAVAVLSRANNLGQIQFGICDKIDPKDGRMILTYTVVRGPGNVECTTGKLTTHTSFVILDGVAKKNAMDHIILTKMKAKNG